MSLLEKIQADTVTALKAKNEQLVGTLRQLTAQFKNKAIEKRAELDDAEIIQVLKKELKKRQESAQLYRQGNREDLAIIEEAEIKIIEQYLPQALSEDDLRAKVQEIIIAKGLGDQQFGQQMKTVMAELGAVADGTMVSKILKELSAK